MSHSQTEARLARVRRFVAPMVEHSLAVDEALPALRRLLSAASVPFRIVGGVAVVHHGYVRATVDIDVLIDAGEAPRLDTELEAQGFTRESPVRLRHAASGVPIDLLHSGGRIPPRGVRTYPRPAALAPSDDEPDIVGLAGLVELKLAAGRHRDVTDVVELLKLLDEASYLALEASLPAELRPELVRLYRDALEELGFGR